MLRQVDISGKQPVRREAIASGKIFLRGETLAAIKEGKVEKGDPIQLARIAGIQAAKLVPTLMPLCHQLRLEHVDVNLNLNENFVEVRARVVAFEKTGVEMEALTAVTVALLNVWDAVKALEKDDSGQYPYTRISDVKVEIKIKG